MTARILTVAANDDLADHLRAALADHLVQRVRSAGAARRHLRQEVCDLVLAEREFLGESGELLEEVASAEEPPGLIALVASEDAEERASLLARGVLAVVHSGLPLASLAAVLGTLIDRERARRAPPRPPGANTSLDDFLSDSATMRELVDTARRAARADSTLLLLGETGVGKEYLARAIHAESGRRGPFVAVSCAALPEHLIEGELFGHRKGAFTGADRPRRGYFEAAHGGTLFLDEIAELPPHVQVKLLRVLQDRRVQPLGSEREVPVDMRLMAATNRDVEREVRDGRLRSDLYYRLAVVTLRIPALRERREDIAGLAASYASHFSRHLGRPARLVDAEALERMTAYAWPGNVRELINVVERAVLLSAGPSIGLADLPLAIRVGSTPPGAAASGVRLTDRPLLEARDAWLADFERRYLEQVLRETGGRVGLAAERAGITPRSLYEKMRRLGLRKEAFRQVVIS